MPTSRPTVIGGLADMATAPNLDLNDKLVKRGLLVSWGGLRLTVQRVRNGRCLVYHPRHTAPQWLRCRAVQVVKP